MKRLVLLLCCVLALTGCTGGEHMTGTGTSADPYIITNRADLEAVASDMTAYYELGADIDLAGTNWIPLGWDTPHTTETIFEGQLDGKSHKVQNMSIVSTVDGERYLGLFADVSGTIKNLSVCNYSITANSGSPSYIGGIAGQVNGSAVIDHCSSVGVIDCSGSSIGGIAGLGYDDNEVGTQTISNCYAKLSLTGEYTGYVGGIIGYAVEVSITDCTASLMCREGSNVACIGGIMGTSQWGFTADGCIATVDIDVSGGDTVGGCVGFVDTQDPNSTISITDSRATGTITTTDHYVGGFIGVLGKAQNPTITIARCMADVDCTGTDTVAGFIGLTNGYNGSYTISDCFALGSATATSGSAAGFIGDAYYGTGTTGVVTFQRCYSGGAVTATGTSKGFCISSADSAVFTSCYWDTETSNCATSAAGTGKTTAEMQMQGTFTGWDFSTVWNIASSVYPFLRTAFVTVTNGCAPVAHSFPWVGRFQLTHVTA